MRTTTKKSKKVEDLLYSTFRGNAATRYGSAKETETIEQYITYQKMSGHFELSVCKCGLVVSTSNPWLAASPDGFVEDPSNTKTSTWYTGGEKSIQCSRQDFR